MHRSNMKTCRTVANPKLAWPFTLTKPKTKREQLRDILKSLGPAPF